MPVDVRARSAAMSGIPVPITTGFDVLPFPHPRRMHRRAAAVRRGGQAHSGGEQSLVRHG